MPACGELWKLRLPWCAQREGWYTLHSSLHASMLRSCSDRVASLKCSPVLVAIQPGHEGATREVFTQQPAVLGWLQACTCTADQEV